MIGDLKHQLRHGNIITKLLIVNVGVFALQSILLLFFVLSGKREIFESFLDWFYFPASFHAQAGINDFLHKPWTILTYQFFHDPANIMHILFNMLYLWFFGRILLDFLNSKFILPLYLAGGVVGAILFMLTYHVSPLFQTYNTVLLGASASILAIVIAAATLVPNYTVMMLLLGPVRLKYIALVAVLIDIVSISAGSNAGGHIAHIGGALTGYFYIVSYKSGRNWLAWWPRLENKFLQLFRRPSPRVVVVNKQPSKPTSKKNDAEKQKQMDAILDKIAQSGYDSLSKSEKEFLFQYSSDKE